MILSTHHHIPIVPHVKRVLKWLSEPFSIVGAHDWLVSREGRSVLCLLSPSDMEMLGGNTEKDSQSGLYYDKQSYHFSFKEAGYGYG